MRTEIKRFHQLNQATSVYVTHDQLEAMTLADRLVVMKDGIVQQEGTPLEVFDLPRNLFVASFLGNPSMNFIDCTLAIKGNNQIIETKDKSFCFTLPESKNIQEKTDGEYDVVLGIRRVIFILVRIQTH